MELQDYLRDHPVFGLMTFCILSSQFKVETNF
jgi:hypothetical protein